jgi:3-methylcrotonyl-CoA carboxylase alpha subunit
MSDRQICIGDSAVGESYLSIEKTVDGALAAGADAVHPGFGFLSENADFAQALQDKKIQFVGPSPEAIRKMGDKIEAKKIIETAKIPTVPGYNGDDQSLKTLKQEAERIGYPVIVKAAAGGGGRGMKVIRQPQEAGEMIEAAKREGLSAFGSEQVFLEKYLDHAKHIEIQVFGDLSGNVVHLFERECSVQRRHQKIVEEAVSGAISSELRRGMTDAAVKLAKAVDYMGAGTVEFLVQDNEFYFLEMNTRLQVEHPVTELVLGVDLVKAQILNQMNRFSCWSQDLLVPRGHAIECRLYAEDPYSVGIPSTGVIGHQDWPVGPGRRFDFGYEQGDEVTSFYDSMMAKVIVWDETRPRAIRKMLRTLDDCVLFGVKTNIPFLKQILSHPEFVEGRFNTQFINQFFPEGAKAGGQADFVAKVGELCHSRLAEAPGGAHAFANPFAQPWSNV